ncbi:DNA-binding protein [Pseudoxanthomonas mexicana]
MARGITETDVHTAADELVAAGERPTVDRIRAHLGTGSPNTVTRWLETWWQGLAPRLHTHALQLALPAAPVPVSRLAQQLWEQALAAARTEAEQALAQDRLHLDAQRRGFETEEAAKQAQLQKHAVAEEQARQQLVAAENRLSDLKRASDLQQDQIGDLNAQRATLEARCGRLEADLVDSQRRATLREEALLADRDVQALHLRAVEDRAHGEIDRARQEAKELRAQLSALQRTRETLQHQRDQAIETAGIAQREASVQRGRAEALEQQFERLGDLPATVEATLAQIQPARKPSRESPGKASVAKGRVQGKKQKIST